MSVAVNKHLVSSFLSDLREVMSLDYLQDVPVASSLQIHFHDQYEVFLGKRKLPLREVGYTKFSVACTLLFAGKENPMDTECPWTDIYFREQNESRALLKHYARKLLERHEFSGEFKLALKSLRMSGKGSRGTQICSPDDEPRFGVIGGLLVDYPFNFRGGEINVTRDSRTESFDFSKNSKADNMISILFWHAGSLVMTEPLKKGFRAFLLCDVVVDCNDPAPLFLDPNSVIMRNFEEDVLRRLETPLSVVRILIRRYWDSPETAPEHFIRLCKYVIDIYLRRLDKAKSLGALRNRVTHERVLEDGWELYRSFGGDNLRRFCGVSLAIDFFKHLNELSR